MAALKTYYSNIPVCNIQVMRHAGYCETLQFIGGRLDTDDVQVQEHLDAICDKPGFIITSRTPEMVAHELNTAELDARKAAEVAQSKMVKAGEKTA